MYVHCSIEISHSCVVSRIYDISGSSDEKSDDSDEEPYDDDDDDDDDNNKVTKGAYGMLLGGYSL